METKTKVVLILSLVLLISISLIIVGTIGANIEFSEVSLQVLSIKNLFLGMIKLMPLIFIISIIFLIYKHLE